MKKISLISFFITLFIITCFLWERKKRIVHNHSESIIHFIISDTDRVPFSVSPTDSDLLQHIMILEQITGTLIKYGGSARYENYLAERWEVSLNKKIWDFYLRPNLKTDSGEVITAEEFAKSLKRLFRMYLKSSNSLMSFDNIKGINTFKSGSSEIEGIQALSKLHLRFEFSEPPIGFIEDLSIAQFSYYSVNDFKNGEWADKRKITSSGAYKISTWQKDGTIILLKRPEWFSHVAGSADKVIIKVMNLDDASKIPSKKTIIQRILRGKNEILNGYTKIQGTPSWLTYLSLSPYVGFFKEKNNRQWFRDSILERHEKNNLDSIVANKTIAFFPVGDEFIRDEILKKITSGKSIFKNQNIIIASSLGDGHEKKYINQLINESLEGSKISYRFHRINTKNDIENILSNKHFDLRIGIVQTGGVVEPGIIKMMFCTNLGVNFPDPSGRVCTLIDEFMKNKININDFGNKFHKIVYDDAAVIPIFYSGLSWLFSNDLLGIDSVSPTMDVPRFDLINTH